jgi:aconitate hydratase
MTAVGQDTLKARRTLTVGGQEYHYFSIPEAAKTLGDVARLPVSLKVLLENVLRFEDGQSYHVADAEAIAGWLKSAGSTREVPFKPARILMQDFTGVPAVVDLAGILRLGGDPAKVNPLVPVDLVIDHSVMVDAFGTADALEKNVAIEFRRNGERYQFLRWGQTAFDNFRVVPPGTGICHQVNLEYLAQTVWTAERDGATWAYPDTLFGTDSHTTMVNGLGVLGWGVGGIEAEAAMLGQPIAMLIPDVIGVRVTGRLPEGVTATDLVLTATQMLRKKGVVGKFVEFFGPGLDAWTGSRWTICASPVATRRASPWSRRTPRRRECGATPARPIRCSPTRWSWTSARFAPAWPARSGRRTACCCTTPPPRSRPNSPRAWACPRARPARAPRWPARPTTSATATW